jgi:hypothetical protein
VTAVVVAEAVAIGILALLVSGLLRTQARIVASVRPGPPAEQVIPALEVGRAAPAVSGVDLDGHRSLLDPQERTVLAFLTSGCTNCAWWWEQLSSAGRDLMSVVVVTPDSETDAAEDVRLLAGAGLRVIMSSDAWEGYGVRAGSTFVVVEGGQVRAGGTASSWDGLVALLRAAALSERRR